GVRKLHLTFPAPSEAVQVAALRDGVVDGMVGYKLLAALLHEGELAGGHYRAIVRRQGDWFCMDDTRSSRLPGTCPAGVDHLVYGLLLQRGG
ncbi:MAG: hypothetical protein ACKPKO_44920, partial [Candidatus Fonsibacter sp.]